MHRHKWKDTTVLNNISRTEECVKCGISREWIYRNYQCWRYSIIIPYKAQNGSTNHSLKHTFSRPECIESKKKEEKEITHGLGLT